MERIKQAIEKAKQLQPLAETAGRKPSRARPRPKPGEAIGSLNYTETRVVQLDPAHLERQRIVAFNKNDPLSMSFDLLRTQVLQKMEENGWRTLAITSPTPDCGKTLVAINLAMSIAQQTGKTAMLVDFDLRKPKVAEYLGLPVEKSLNDVFRDEATLNEALVNPGLPRLVVLPTARREVSAAEMLATARVDDLIGELRERYEERIVIFDLPPLVNTDDALTVLPKIDCVLLVIGNGMVSKTELEESLRHLPATNLIGTVLNKADTAANKYYY